MNLTTPQILVLLLVFAAAVMAVVVFLMLLRDAQGSTWLSYLGPRWLERRRRAKRLRQFNARILDLTMGLASALRAGMSLTPALDKVGAQMGGVMHEELDVTLREHRLGVGIVDAMDRLAERMPSEDMRLLVSTIRLTAQTGGSMADVLEQMVRMIRGRVEFQQKLQTLMAQGKFESLAIAAAPLVAFGLLYFLQPDLMRPLVTTTVGWIAIAVALTLEAIGFIIIRRIVTIEV